MRLAAALLCIALVLGFSPTALAACSGTVNGTPTTAAVLTGTDYANGRPSGSITPDCFRDLVASGAGNAANVINLRNLGLPTGGDDTTAINNALSSAKSSGLAVYAPAGDYKHAGVIFVDSVKFFGDGAATIIESSNTSGTNPNNSIEMIGTNPAVMDMSVKSDWASTRQSNGEACGIYLNGATGFMVYRNYVSNAASCSIMVSASVAGEVVGNHISGGKADGVIHQSAGPNPSHDNLVLGNYATGTGDDCFSIDTTTGDTPIYNIRIIGNYCTGGLARGITINGTHTDVISGNIIQAPASHGINVTGETGFAESHDIVIDGNVIKDGASGQVGILVNNSSTLPAETNIAITNNALYNQQHDCIDVGGGAAHNILNVTISHNECDAAASGASVGSTIWGADNVTISENTYKGWPGDGIVNLPATATNGGYMTIRSNIFDGCGSTGNVIEIDTGDALTALTVEGNEQYADGVSPAGTTFLVQGVSNLTFRDNYRDTPGFSISGVTAGQLSSPYTATQSITANAQTISYTMSPSITLTTTGAFTGIIMGAGLATGQTITLINNSSSTITWNATDATAHVKNASGNTIAANSAMKLTYDNGTGLWWKN